jgi:hypothetical protein
VPPNAAPLTGTVLAVDPLPVVFVVVTFIGE